MIACRAGVDFQPTHAHIHAHATPSPKISASRRVCLMGTIQFVSAVHEAAAQLKDHFAYVCHVVESERLNLAPAPIMHAMPVGPWPPPPPAARPPASARHPDTARGSLEPNNPNTSTTTQTRPTTPDRTNTAT